MNLWQALVLGVIEGITEFLPISSTGHMILARPWLGIDPNSVDWRVFLFVSQLGAILAVVVLYWRELWRRTFQSPRDWRRYIWTKLLVALAPSVVVGLALHDFLERYLEDNAHAVAGALIVGGLIMEWIDRRFRRENALTIDDVTLRQAFWVGLGQCLSLWPGTSRAGASIFAGMVVGLSPRVAAEFSFLLAIPTMLGAAAKTFHKHHAELTAGNGPVLLFGTAVAFGVALIVVSGFIRFVQHRRFTVFAAYRIVLGLAVILYYSLMR